MKRKVDAGGIALSFDDASVKEWYNLRPLFKKYSAKVTFFVTMVGKLDSSQISMLKILEADGHEIASHGEQHVLCTEYVDKYSRQKYVEDEIVQSINAMNRSGFKPTTFAFPYGEGDKFVDVEALKYFYLTRYVVSRNEANLLTELEDVFYKFDGARKVAAIGIDVNSRVTFKDIKEALKRCQRNKEALLLYAHVPSSSNDPYTFKVEFLEKILRLNKQLKLKTYTMSELVK